MRSEGLSESHGKLVQQVILIDSGKATECAQR